MAQVGHLSGSTSGKGILIAQTATPGDTVHTAVAATDQLDRVYIYLMNTHSLAVTATLEFGDTVGATNIVKDIPANSGIFVLIEGLTLQNSLSVAMFASVTNVVTAFGHVIRSTVAEAFN